MATLYYVHDPMCSWCWGFAPALKHLLDALPEDIKVKRLLGGLAVDSDAPMPIEMQTMLQETWHRIQTKIPDTKFNFDFWTKCQPRRSTYPSCRAVIAARQQGELYDALMTTAIQKAYYQQARNPSDIDTLTELATELGLDADKFKQDIASKATQQTLEEEIELCRELHAESFPSLVLQVGTSTSGVPIDYNNTASMLKLINNLRD